MQSKKNLKNKKTAKANKKENIEISAKGGEIIAICIEKTGMWCYNII